MSHGAQRTRRMVQLMEQLAPLEGYNLSPLEDIRFLRCNRPLTRTPVLYEPGIVILCQGRKRGYLGDDVYIYDAQHYLVVSVPVPFTMETDASEEEPMLAVYMRLDFKVAGELLLEIDEIEIEEIGVCIHSVEPTAALSARSALKKCISFAMLKE